MSRDEGLAAAMLAIVMGGAIALAIASDIAGPACVAAKAQVGAAKDFEFGCLEFWLNRYQSLLGNMLTATVAAVTLLWIARQLSEMNRQSAVAARQLVLSKIESYSAELSAIERISQSSGTIAGYLKNLNMIGVRNQGMLQFYDAGYIEAGALREHNAIIERYTGSEPSIRRRTQFRRDFYMGVERLSRDSADFINRLRSNIYYDNFPPSQIEPEAAAVVRATEMVDVAGLCLRNEIVQAVERAWAEVHRLETIVRGGEF